MHRILIFVTALFIIWKLVAAFGKRSSKESSGADDFSRFSAKQRDHRRRMKNAAQQAQQELVECAECSTFVPAGRVLRNGDGPSYCSERCRSAGTSRPDGDG